VVVYTATYDAGGPEGQAATLVVCGGEDDWLRRHRRDQAGAVALCSLFNHCCNPNMVCGTGRRARCSGGAAPDLIDTPVLTVVRVRGAGNYRWCSRPGKKEAAGPESSASAVCAASRPAEPNWLFTV
jgi:hypothetical protein